MLDDRRFADAEAIEVVRPGGTVIEAGAFCGAGTVPVDPNLVCAKGIAVLEEGTAGGAMKVLVAPNGIPA